MDNIRNIIDKYQLKNRDIQDLTVLVYVFSLILGCSMGFKIFDNIYFKIWLFILLVYTYENNKIMGIIIGLMLFFVYQYIIRRKLDTFMNISGVENIHSEYDTKPLLNKTQINEDVENLELETPEQKHLKLIRNGEMLLNEAQELQNDVNLLYDWREREIIDTTKYNAMVNINTGKNFFEGDVLSINSEDSLKTLQNEYDNLIKANDYKDLKN